MKLSLYMRLAAQAIRQNRRLYMPYLLSGACMVTIFQILLMLVGDPALRAIPGGDSMGILLMLGVFVMGLFSTFFLLYTSSFIMKQRTRELGLYNVLGMGKRHIACIVFFETAFCALICTGAGIALGVLTSKAFQLGLLRLTGNPAAPDFSIAPEQLTTTLIAFPGIFLLVFLRSAWLVARVSPAALMRENRTGEAPPRANWALALLGAALLAAGYALAIRVQSALDAFSLFFPAVLLVIAGTYLCFISASVTMLRLLQENKAYYYKPEHFISVSSMRYRMKRSGASLATICILSTMVLVILASVVSLYCGTEDALCARYPRDIEFTLRQDALPHEDMLRAPVERALTREGVAPQRVLSYRSLSFTSGVNGIRLTSEISVTTRYAGITAMLLSDYNALFGTDYALTPGEALACGSLRRTIGDHFSFGGVSYALTDDVIADIEDGTAQVSLLDRLLLVVPTAEDMNALYDAQAAAYGDDRSRFEIHYAFDTGLPRSMQSPLFERLCAALDGLSLMRYARETERAAYVGVTVGFLFLGALLSAAFLSAAVLSMYYKQITEGYEDQARYAIMCKIGLSKAMIRRSVRSQMRTVFLLPLAAAAVHMAFAFPMLTKLLMLFGLFNARLFALTTLGAFAAFALLYVTAYAVTSRTYEKIVSSPA